MEKKGTVTPISSVFPAEEAQKASRRVQETIVERQQQLDQLKGFVDDNISLINLVQKLPEETHHNIMVPFGKAAFFPGRLIHTNEFMVLLGEGYYAERTSKQTIEILKRREKTLENQVESLKAIMQDLKAEASFFDDTAHESLEGLIEIREEYVEEDNAGLSPTAGNRTRDSPVSLEVDGAKAALQDEEYNRILLRMLELEKEEEEAEKAGEADMNEQIENEPERSTHQISSDQTVQVSEVSTVSEDVSLHGNHQTSNPSMRNKDPKLPAEKEQKVQAPLTTSNEAFTGSIVEHAHNIGKQMPEKQTSSQTTKPVSRFKMQRK